MFTFGIWSRGWYTHDGEWLRSFVTKTRIAFTFFIKALLSQNLLPLSSNNYDFVSGDQSRQSFRSSSLQHSQSVWSYPRLPTLKGMWPSLWSLTNMLNVEPHVFCLLHFVEWMPCFTRVGHDAERQLKSIFHDVIWPCGIFFFFGLSYIKHTFCFGQFFPLVLHAVGC